MAALKRQAGLSFQAGACLGLLLLLPASLLAQAGTSTLYAQATSTLLDRSFPSGKVEYLLLDLRTGQTVAVRWPGVEKPIPVGSLLKPFVALAYDEMQADAHSSTSPAQRFPVLRCHGKGDGCWSSVGHGSLTLEQAVAESCNAYFLTLARDLAASRDSLDRVSAAYGLPAPPAANSERQISPMLIGVTPEWRIAPITLAHAYAALATGPRSDTISRLLTGMKLAASPGGTAARIGRHPGGVLAKTGTAPCVPDRDSDSGRCLVNGDGLVVVLAPAENPNLLLLVRQRGTTGAATAGLAGQMLSLLEGAHAQAR
jgi:hypothetical protein